MLHSSSWPCPCSVLDLAKEVWETFPTYSTENEFILPLWRFHLKNGNQKAPELPLDLTLLHWLLPVITEQVCAPAHMIQDLISH